MKPLPPYQPPASDTGTPETGDLSRKLRIWKRIRLISLVLCLVLPINGIVGTVIGMTGAFEELRNTGAADPSELASHISVALLSTFWGLVIAVPALIVVVISAIRVRSLKRSLAKAEQPT